MRALSFVVLLSLQLSFIQSLNILVLWPHIGKSHYDVFRGLFKTLAGQGHNVTVISLFPEESPLDNYREIILIPEKSKESGLGILKLEDLLPPRLEMYNGPKLVTGFANIACPDFLKNEKVHSFIAEDKPYDVVLVENFNTNCQFGVLKAMNYKGPVIGLSTCTSLPWINPMYGVPDNPSYIPNMFLDHTNRMSFFQRVENTILVIVHKIMYDILMRRPGNKLSKKYLGEDILSGGDMEYNSSLLLSNTHFSFTFPRPLPPNVIEVAGIHITEDKPLPKNLETYVKHSPHGVAYMSMGSMLKGTSFPQAKREQFLKAFAKLKLNVIWKWESETMDGKPDNVLLAKWTPQKDLLCHPKVKAFITHGGLLGTLEAVHCGVPMIVIPQFGDQHHNAANVESNGIGVRMLIGDATDELISKNLKTVLSEKYQEKAKEVSRRFRDRPLPPMETAIYWINYVAKHGGAKFMRTAAVDMPFYQYYLLDVIAFLLVLGLISLLVGLKIAMIVFDILFQRKQKFKQN